MAVPEQIPYVGYIANGQTTEFPITFDLHDPEFLVVTLNKEIPLVGTYTIDMNAKKVVFATAPNDNDQVELYRETELNRDTDYKSYDNSFRPEAVNYDFDTVMCIFQEQNMIDAEIASKIKGEIEWRRTHDANFDELAKIREQNLGQELVAYINTIIGMSNPNIFDGISDRMVVTFNNLSQSEFNKKSTQNLKSVAEMLTIENPLHGQIVRPESWHEGMNKGGGTFVYDSAKSSINDGVTIINGWKRSSFVYLTPEMAGAKGNGVTDDTTAWENILKLNLSIQCQKDSKYLTSRLLLLKNKAHVQLNGSRIINTTTSAFFAEEQFNIQICDGSIHGLTEFGDFGQSTDDGRWGLCFRNCQKSMPNSLEIKGFGTGLWFLGVGNPATGEPVSYSKPIACITSHNYVGAKYSGDFGAEYLNALSCDSFKNYFCGLWVESGNFSATGGTTTSNYLHGVYLKASSNGGHGNINGMKINHNWGRNVLVDSVQQGFIFNGCNIFDDNTVDKTIGAIEFAGCKGIKFNACQIMANVIANGLNQSGDVLLNQFMNCEFYGTRGDFISSDGSDNGVLFKDCTQGNEPFRRNSKGINFSYVNNVVSLVPVGASLLRFNQIASAVGKKMLDVNSGIFVAQTTGIHTVNLNLICNKPFKVALLLDNNVVANAIADQQDASKYILNWTFNYYFEKNSQFNFAITNISDSAGALENSSTAYIYI